MELIQFTDFSMQHSVLSVFFITDIRLDVEVLAEICHLYLVMFRRQHSVLLDLLSGHCASPYCDKASVFGFI